MEIIIPRNSFLQELFPAISDYKELTENDITSIKKVYTLGKYKPQVEVTENLIKIVFDEHIIQKENQKFEQAVQLSEQQKYDQALSLLNQLIEKNPVVSEYHRIKGQILSDQNYPQKAIDELIEAVRLDPDNTSALIMLGNIYAKDQSDAETALTFYERVLETDPENHLALNNIGGNLANLGKYDDAQRYFELAHELNPDYPNTLYGLALLESRLENAYEAFEYAPAGFL